MAIAEIQWRRVMLHLPMTRALLARTIRNIPTSPILSGERWPSEEIAVGFAAFSGLAGQLMPVRKDMTIAKKRIVAAK
jgi:hypothetical protein